MHALRKLKVLITATMYTVATNWAETKQSEQPDSLELTLESAFQTADDNPFEGILNTGVLQKKGMRFYQVFKPA